MTIGDLRLIAGMIMTRRGVELAELQGETKFPAEYSSL